jgi:hypothetical protein
MQSRKAGYQNQNATDDAPNKVGIMKKYIEKAITFGEYNDLIDRLLAAGKTTGPRQSESLTNFTRLNVQRMARLAKTIELESGTVNKVSEKQRPQTWLIITEGWCGDAAQNIPVIEKIAAENDTIRTRYILRDENRDLMDRFLTNGARSIPKLIAIDQETEQVLWIWGARPVEAQALYESLHTDDVEKPQIMERLQRWYNDDKGRSVQKEIVGLLEQVDKEFAGRAAA